MSGTLIRKTEKIDSKYAIITRMEIEPPFPISSSQNMFGLDPGTTNVGIATVWRNVVRLYQVKMVREPNAVKRILQIQYVLSECIKMYDFAPIMIIEGSSFGDHYRQVELAEIRASAVLWAISHDVTPCIVPPRTIRKAVFGSGKVKADEVWTELLPDSASALACAYYGLNASSKEDSNSSVKE